MSECHRPRLTVDYLTDTLRDAMHADRAAPSFDLRDLEALIRAAEERSRPRTQLPPQLNHFPFTWSHRLQQLFLTVYKRLFHDQRAVNTVLIQALRQTLAVNRYLLDTLAEQSRLPETAPARLRLTSSVDEGNSPCVS